MSQTITITVPDAIAEEYPTMVELKNIIYENMIIREFQKGVLSIRESAQLLGLTYEGFMEWLGKRKISFITATPEELEESYQEFERRMQTKTSP